MLSQIVAAVAALVMLDGAALVGMTSERPESCRSPAFRGGLVIADAQWRPLPFFVSDAHTKELPRGSFGAPVSVSQLRGDDDDVDLINGASRPHAAWARVFVPKCWDNKADWCPEAKLHRQVSGKEGVAIKIVAPMSGQHHFRIAGWCCSSVVDDRSHVQPNSSSVGVPGDNRPGDLHRLNVQTRSPLLPHDGDLVSGGVGLSSRFTEGATRKVSGRNDEYEAKRGGEPLNLGPKSSFFVRLCGPPLLTGIVLVLVGVFCGLLAGTVGWYFRPESDSDTIAILFVLVVFCGSALIMVIEYANVCGPP